jgi:hypothetical protein
VCMYIRTKHRDEKYLRDTVLLDSKYTYIHISVFTLHTHVCIYVRMYESQGEEELTRNGVTRFEIYVHIQVNLHYVQMCAYTHLQNTGTE